MKRYIFILLTAPFLSSCSKDKCWVMMDCMGNDIGSYCGTESQVQYQCQRIATPTCPCSYRRE
ncbi:MAG TPA: hypothetical protein VMZ03_07710 [Chitinophagaceae bacterium]|nr:hypothetical protein [Chitinophagaceae bacterium]